MKRLGIALGATVLLTVSPVVHLSVAYAAANVVLRDGSIEPTHIIAQKNKPLDIGIVNQGSKIHNFVIPDFYIFTSNLKPGERTSVEFHPEKSGSFPYYSDKNGIPEAGMHGILTVQS